MGEVASIPAEPRVNYGKGPARRLRAAARVPAVIYGGGSEPVGVSVGLREIAREIHRSGFFSRLYDLSVNGEKLRVLPRDVQLDPVTDIPVHVDFLRFEAGQKITVSVPVSFREHEASPGLKRGGVLNIVRHEIELVCQVESIPEEIEFDLTDREIGDSLHISDVTLPEGVTPLVTDRDFTVATVAAPTVRKEEEAAAQAEAEAAAEALEAGEEGEEAAAAEGEGEAPAETESTEEKKEE
jgi:large subunit ribosomal protein L25